MTEEGFSINGIEDIFILDHIAGRLADANTIGIYLGVKNEEITAIKQQYSFSPTEVTFQILHRWYINNTDNRDRKFQQFKKVLSDVGRLDIVETNFSKNDFKSEIEITDPQRELNQVDARLVASLIGFLYTRFARFVGIDQHKLEQIIIDNDRNVQEQAYQVLLQCIHGKKLTCRQQLCHGLVYVQRRDIILRMKEEWERRNLTV